LGDAWQSSGFCYLSKWNSFRLVIDVHCCDLYSMLFPFLARCYATVLQQACGSTSAASINSLTTLLFHAKYSPGSRYWHRCSNAGNLQSIVSCIFMLISRFLSNRPILPDQIRLGYAQAEPLTIAGAKFYRLDAFPITQLTFSKRWGIILM